MESASLTLQKMEQQLLDQKRQSAIDSKMKQSMLLTSSNQGGAVGGHGRDIHRIIHDYLKEASVTVRQFAC
jgi:hypothetical protein